MDQSYYKNYFVLERGHWFFRVRKKILIFFIEKYIEPGSKIFDFGCGSGYLVRELQKMGYDAFGTDVSIEAIEFGQSRGIRNLSVAQGGEIKPPEGGFDLILALDVIEHTEDDSETVRYLKGALKQGGRAIVTVPAYQWMWGVQDEVAHHFRRYTMSGLVDVIKKSGDFKIVHKTYFNTFLFVPIAIVRILSKWFNLKNRESDFDIDSRVLSALFYFVFNIETYLLKFMDFPFGVSVLVVLEKTKFSHE
ncbi:MAG: class I SAM-dependent methyltransferase [bacterium]|nr:class I SAM-dependent methyltransferase [bacterium]